MQSPDDFASSVATHLSDLHAIASLEAASAGASAKDTTTSLENLLNNVRLERPEPPALRPAPT